MTTRLADRLVPDELWKLVEPLLPKFRPRPQGGGTAPLDQRAVFTAVVYVLTSGCAWRDLPEEFSVSPPTAHRRFQAWTRAGVWPRLHRGARRPRGRGRGRLVVGDRGRGGPAGEERRPADRSEPGRPRHTGFENPRPLGRRRTAAGRGVSAANLNDSLALAPLVLGIPAVRSRRGPRRRRPDTLRADKGYDSGELRGWLRGRGIVPRIARRGVESGERLGRYRWKIERTIAWLDGYRRLTIRYERHAQNFLGFLSLAAALTCWKKLAT